MKFEIMTHGSSGIWSMMVDCQAGWDAPVASTLEEALEVCRKIKGKGYGVCLFQDGRRLLSAPWQVPVELGLIVEVWEFQNLAS